MVALCILGQMWGNEQIFADFLPYVTLSLQPLYIIFYSSFIYCLDSFHDSWFFKSLSCKDMFFLLIDVLMCLLLCLFFLMLMYIHDLILKCYYCFDDKKMKIYPKQMTSWLKCTAVKTSAWVHLEKRFCFFPFGHYFVIRKPSDISKWVEHFQKLFLSLFWIEILI